LSGIEALTTDISLYEVGTGAVLGAAAVALAPVAIAVAGEALAATGAAVGSAQVFAAGMSVSAAAVTAASIVYGPGTGNLQGVVDRGFGGSTGLYDDFSTTLRQGLPSGTQVAFRGSVVTNRSWMTGAPFDGRGAGTSDLDIALLGDDVMSMWSPSAFYLPGTNSMPLSDMTPQVAPALNGLRLQLQSLVGRPVNFQATTNSFLELRRIFLNQGYVGME